MVKSLLKTLVTHCKPVAYKAYVCVLMYARPSARSLYGGMKFYVATIFESTLNNNLIKKTTQKAIFFDFGTIVAPLQAKRCDILKNTHNFYPNKL